METEPVFTEAQKLCIKKLMEEALHNYFESKGKTVKNLIILSATVVGSLVVIFGGLKSILGWLGFHYIGK